MYNFGLTNLFNMFGTGCNSFGGYGNYGGIGGYNLVNSLFSGVDGRSVFATCDNGSRSIKNNNWSAGSIIGLAFGLAAVGVGGFMGITAWNNHRTKQAEQQARPDELQKQINKYDADITKQLQILGVETEDAGLNFDIEGQIQSLQGDANTKNNLYENAQKATENAQADYDKLKERDRILGIAEANRSDAEKKYLAETTFPNMTLLEAETALKQKKEDEATALKNKQDADKALKEAQDNKSKKIEAKRKLQELITKRNDAKKELDELKAEQNAQRMDDADGSRLFRTQNYKYDSDGKIATSTDQFKNSDWRGLISEYRTTTDSTRKTAIKNFVDANWNYIRDNVKASIKDGLRVIHES